ncbi:MAG: tryptophan--tRNA ligase [Candidatus Eisenbacteria bacterium]|uniref:Tryptophan--tRNA ligase n=1 Tax=Eiseniibacteriota bacterium TaxID=2212470 RepID=A0A9D6L8B1_UNCEI|nr:tryptophan--tRNA ligase [Candidatus Eisenbacteria bacterium]MBI3539719.1 tryptophan--tRNA ligase [Candidatus Eisenbacteria bacterium]
MKPGRILSGMRPTGRLHLGNWVGALENWVRLQNEGWSNYHMVADWHMLTTGHDDTSRLQSDTHEMVVDWLAAGLDPEKSVIFVQSAVKEHAELHLLFSMLVSKARLERIPTLKEQIRDLHLDEQTISYGHLGYSVLQAADILLYRATHVPVGEDQVPHVELTREIARRFNHLYCRNRAPVFPEPEAMLTRFPRLRGNDGQRMSKSAGNALMLAATPDEIAVYVKGAYTDPKKIRANDPGRPEADPSDGHPGCVVWEYHRKFTPSEAETIARKCRAGELACVPDKQHLTRSLADALAPIRERRARWADDPDAVREVIADGNRRARAVAERTMDEVRGAMGLASTAEVPR